MVRLRIEPVVHAVVRARAELEKAVARLGAAAVGQDRVVARDVECAQGIVGDSSRMRSRCGGRIHVPDEGHRVCTSTLQERGAPDSASSQPIPECLTTMSASARERRACDRGRTRLG